LVKEKKKLCLEFAWVAGRPKATDKKTGDQLLLPGKEQQLENLQASK
jgi:hypothetical protein